MGPTKMTIIVNLPPPMNVKQLRATPVNTRYYRKFIREYVAITTLMENLLKKYAQFECSP